MYWLFLSLALLSPSLFDILLDNSSKTFKVVFLKVFYSNFSTNAVIDGFLHHDSAPRMGHNDNLKLHKVGWLRQGIKGTSDLEIIQWYNLSLRYCGRLSTCLTLLQTGRGIKTQVGFNVLLPSSVPAQAQLDWVSFIINLHTVWAGVHAAWAGVHSVWAGVHSRTSSGNNWKNPKTNWIKLN